MERDGADARRHGRHRRRHSHVAPGLGGVRPRRPFHGPAGGLHDLQTPLPRRPRRADAVRQPRMAQGGPDCGDLPWRQDRGAAVQHDVQDLRRPGGGERVRRLSAAGDGAGHLRQLPQCARHEPQEIALRHRADREVVPQRDHARQLHLPHARVRADGDGVLRQARHRARVARVLGRPAHQLVSRISACAPRTSVSATCRRRTSRTTPRGRTTIEYLLPGGLGWAELEGVASRGDYDLTRHQEASGQRHRPTSTKRRRSATCRMSSNRRSASGGRCSSSSSTPTTRSRRPM